MGSESYLYSNHAVKQMFQRGISTVEVEQAIERGEIVKDYPDDKPFPSKLVLAWVNQRPLHVVYSIDEEKKITVVITSYIPSTDIWEEDFKTKKK